MAEYRTIGRADPNVAAQLAAQDQARKAAWHQALLGMLGQTVTGVAQTLQRRDEFQQQVKQQDRYYDLQRQQWEQSSQARDFAASQRLAQLAQEAPELAETLSQTAMGRRLLAQGGWDSALSGVRMGRSGTTTCLPPRVPCPRNYRPQTYGPDAPEPRRRGGWLRVRRTS